jgi:hypothetical protein
MDKIEKTVDKINTRMTDIETKMNELDKRTIETERACAFISNVTDSQKTQIEQSEQNISSMQKSCNDLKEQVKLLESDRQKLGAKLTDLEGRSMRDNLIFYGVPEERNEDCEAKIQDLITVKLSLNTPIQFDRVHRIGKSSGSKPRPIVAKFHEYKAKEIVRQRAYDNKEALKQQGYGVGAQYPKEIRETRKQLFPIMKKAESEGKTVKLTGDKLYINGRLFVQESGRQTSD